ncbi:hypothetical protein RI367_000158 [Sorochytrium milnesiophthora]
MADKPHLVIHPSKDMVIKPTRVNRSPEIIYAILHKNAYYFPLITISSAIQAENLYNKVRKKLNRRDQTRMILSEDDLNTYREMTGNVANVKLFVDEMTLRSLLEDYNLGDQLHVEYLNESLEEARRMQASAEAAAAAAAQNSSAADETAESEDMDEEEAASPPPPPRSRRTVRANSSSTASAAADHTGARHETGVTSTLPRPTSTGDNNSQHAAPISLHYTPYTLEVKVAKRGRDPYYVHWCNLSTMEKFLVFRAALETKDPVLERKRPWMAKFLIAEPDEQFDYYSQRLSTPFKTRALEIIQNTTLPSDQELSQAVSADGAFANVKKRALEDPQSDFRSTKRVNVDQLPDHIRFLAEAFQYNSTAPSSAHAPDSHHSDPTVRKLESQYFYVQHGSQSLVTSLGCFYYDLTSQLEHLRNEVKHLKEELQQVPALKQEIQELRQSLGHTPASPPDKRSPARATSFSADLASNSANGQHAMPVGTPHTEPISLQSSAHPSPFSLAPRSPVKRENLSNANGNATPGDGALGNKLFPGLPQLPGDGAPIIAASRPTPSASLPPELAATPMQL